MKCDRFLTLALIVLALGAFSSAATASTLTSPSGTTYTSTIKAENEGTVTFTSPFGGFGTITCNKSTFEGKVESHGLVPAGGTITKMTYSECNREITVLVKFSFQIHGLFPPKLTFKKREYRIHTAIGPCTFTGDTGDTLTTTETTGGNATIDLSGKLASPCGTGTFEGSYEVTAPSTLYVD
jgi:hypothetical protein